MSELTSAWSKPPSVQAVWNESSEGVRGDREARHQVRLAAERQEQHGHQRVDRDEAEHDEQAVGEGALQAVAPHARSSWPRSPRRTMTTDTTRMRMVIRIAMAAGGAQPAGLEAELVQQDAGHGGRVTGAAARGDPDEVEVAQREDHRQRQRDHDLVAQARQGDGAELLPRAGTVHARRVVQVGGDLLDARHEEHHAQARVEPRAHEADGHQRPVEVAQPRPCEAAQPDEPQRLR